MIKPKGLNHLALVTSDMDRAVRFYSQVLGMKLVRAQRNDDDPNSRHYFLDMGGGNLLTFFDFAGARGGYMHHLAFQVDSAQELERLRQDLEAKAVPVSPIVDHDFIQSIYLRDPDGILLEFSAYTRPLGEADRLVDPDPVPAVKELLESEQ